MSDTNDIYYDTYNEGEAPEEKSRFSVIAGAVWKTASVTVILAIFVLLFYRMWETKEPGGTGDFLWDDATYSAYIEADGEEPVVMAPYDNEDLYVYERENLTTVTLTQKAEDRADWKRITLPLDEYYENESFRVFTANTGSYTVTGEDGAETSVKVTGYYEAAGTAADRQLRVSDCYFIPAANQVQLTFRYKTDILEKLNGKNAFDGSVFRYFLEDQSGTDYEAEIRKTAKRGVYRYVTVVFSDVDFSSVSEFKLVAEYLTEKDASQTLEISVYDSMLPLPVSEVSVKEPDASELSFGKDG